MPAEKPAPITPEGKRAADRVRSIFFMIAAANLVLVAIVMLLNGGGRAGRPDADAKPVAEMQAAFSRALTAYNAADRDAFLTCFSAKTGAATDAEFFSTKIEGGCLRDFGKVTGNEFQSSRVEPDGTGGALVYHVTCEKRQGAQLMAEFVRESGAMKLIGWRIAQPQETR
jgi:hypothetical protein